MMSGLFLQLLNMSINAGWLVLVILLTRQLLKRAPKAIHVALWALVGIRLVLPVSFESVLSLLPSAQTVPTDILYTEVPKIESGVPAINEVINPVIGGVFSPVPGDSVNPMQRFTGIAANLWVIGMAVMMIYAILSFLTLWRKVREAVPETDCVSASESRNIRYSDRVSAPFILGIIRPRIYLPLLIRAEDKEYVIAHETAHLRRRDHWWKPLGYLLLSVYWFNPLLWVAYILLCRDIELACDEKVIREMDVQGRKAYSNALINCSASRRLIAACPLAFGEVGVKQRIRSVLNYRRPAFWIVTVSVILCIGLGVCFLSNPPSDGREQTQTGTEDENGIPSVPVRYVFKDSVDPIEPSILLNFDQRGKSFSFSYSGFSSYLAIGMYEVVDGEVILRTGDGDNTYVFKIVEKGLIFDASRSSQIPSYRYSGDSYETECPVPDGALFEREPFPLPETDEVTVLAWRYEGSKAVSEEITLTDMSFRMEFGVEVYEVIAKWDTSRYYSGEVHYGFRFPTPEYVPNP